MRRHLWDVSRTVLPMRHVFDFNQALMDFGATLCTARKPQVPAVPDARRTAPPIRSTPRTKRRAVMPELAPGASSSPPRSSSATARSSSTRRPRRRAPRRLLGVSRAASAKPASRTRPACSARFVEELGARGRVLSEVFEVTHAYPDRVVELHFFRASCTESRGRCSAGDAMGARDDSRRWSSRRRTPS